ncbi:MAG: hypothetical protein DYG89_10800 [Caldilinea sp. CFX5]|nr:hypothetical protein [Caldilinea sp. CFX5]
MIGALAQSRQAVRRHGPALLAFFLLAALFYAPLLLGIRTFPDGDFTHHFLPFSWYQQQALTTGQLPLWNPYTYSGHPFLADTQAAVFYPISNLLLFLTLSWTTVGERLYWLQAEAVVQVALAGYFVYLLAHALTNRRLAAFAAGCAFAFSGYLTAYPPLQLAVLRTSIWLPLLLYLLWQAMHEPRRWRWWIGVSVAYAVAFCAGHPQTFLHISYTIAAWALFLLIATQGKKFDFWKKSNFFAQLTGLLFFLLLALGLSAAQLLPSLEFSRLSVRANVDYAYVSGGFPLQDTWQLLLPGVLTQFSPLYIGVVGVGLALIGFGYGRLRDKEIERLARQQPTISQSLNLSISLFFGLLAVIALILSYGDNSFLYPLAYHYAPGWNLFRGQERAAFLVTLALSVLVGLGLAALPTLRYPARRMLALFYAMLVAGGTYFFGLFWQLMDHSAISDGQYLLIAATTVGLAMSVVVLLLLPGWRQRRSIVVVGLVIANLFWANFTTNLDQFGPNRKTILAPEMEALGRAVSAAGVDPTGLNGRVYNEFRIYEDYGMRQEIEDVWGSSPLRLARYAALFENFPLDRLWRLTGVTHVLTWRRELFESSELLAEFPQATDTTYLHRLAEPNPRAWLVQEVQPATDAEALALLGDHAFDLEQVALIPTETSATGMTLPTGASKIQVTQRAAGQLYVTVESERGGLLLLSENWLPGWRVSKATCGSKGAACPTNLSSNQQLATLTPYRVNLTLVGLLVPSGVVTFDLVYWPTSVQLGLAISGGTLLLLALLAGWHGWARRRSRHP